ncbi:MAG TPA: TdeIII family type II restriction endonuclease [Candidatus Nanoarchaeia archaeon]|nr:TdeIII family type II restriction endonuclease [Candidatus Nanoarchaeia archaeon]
MTLNGEVKDFIKENLKGTIKKKIENYDFSKKSGNPFVDTIFKRFSNVKSFIHSMATTFGDDYEKIARKIAESNPEFEEVKKFNFTGKISDDESALIKNMVKELEESKEGSDYDEEIKLVYGADENNIKDTKITIDLYLRNQEGKEFFIEMKGPDPNKKEVRAAKEDLLNVVAMKKREINKEDFHDKVAIIFGIYYNNCKGEYKNWKVSPLFERGKGLLVQEEFWDLLGVKGHLTSY